MAATHKPDADISNNIGWGYGWGWAYLTQEDYEIFFRLHLCTDGDNHKYFDTELADIMIMNRLCEQVDVPPVARIISELIRKS